MSPTDFPKPPGLLRLVLAAAFLASPAPRLCAQAPEALVLATPELRHQAEKSILLKNSSGQPWRLGLYATDSDNTGSQINASTYDRKTSTLTSKGEFSPTRSLTVEPGEILVLTPVPAKTVGSRLGLGKRPDFFRKIFLEDGAKKKVDFQIRRSGDGVVDGKKPEIMFVELADLQAYKKVFALAAGDAWLNILKPAAN